MNKQERRKAQLERHYNALEALGAPDGKKASVALLKLERAAHKLTTDQCNGDGDYETNGAKLVELLKKAKSILPNVKGIFINGDARGYALKIQDSAMRELYRESGLQTDWGGYGILAPEITGD